MIQYSIVIQYVLLYIATLYIKEVGSMYVAISHKSLWYVCVPHKNYVF